MYLAIMKRPAFPGKGPYVQYNASTAVRRIFQRAEAGAGASGPWRQPMKGPALWLKMLQAHWIPEAEVRAEAWALGTRHRGEVLEGARRELKAPDLSMRRTILLKAIVRRHSRKGAEAWRKDARSADRRSG
jgi:hypothetical protein